MKNRWRIGEE